MTNNITAFCGSYNQQYDPEDTIYNPIKEEISYAFIHSIASFLGAEMTKNGRMLDNDGIDLTIRLPQNRLGDTKNPKPGLDIQMKCTSSPNYDASKNYLNFELKTNVYEKMKRANNMNPTIFMILILPKDVDKWVSVDPDYLAIRHNALWYNPADDTKEIKKDSSTVRIKIPVENIVDRDSLFLMLKKSAENELIENEVV